MIEEIVCEKCGSSYTYRTTNEIVCRKCGHRKKVEKEIEDNKLIGETKDSDEKEKIGGGENAN